MKLNRKIFYSKSEELLAAAALIASLSSFQALIFAKALSIDLFAKFGTWMASIPTR
jgi:uncharacterized membrane protein